MNSSVRGPQVRIRDLREALGLSVNQLVDRIIEAGYDQKLHADTIRNVELGHKRASKPLMTAWAKALGLVPLDVWQPPAATERTRTEQVPA
ncbi:MAG: helix-turn-helix transcriptional regulator [Mycolicibacterium frederiksbergense]|nr:helix-turn-helix transcriptional regulator [Mycolicibacterium frederiksbergense]